jgi:hypothetical protein
MKISLLFALVMAFVTAIVLGIAAVVVFGTGVLFFNARDSTNKNSPAVEQNVPEAAPAPRAVKQPSEEPAQPSTEAEPLPELPKADPKSTVKQLLPNDKLYLETLPNDRKRILFSAEVCLREGVLEVLLCKTNTKEHEAIIRTPIDARYIHAALVAIGSKPGSHVQFVNPKTGEEEYKPASGAVVNVLVHYRKDGKLHTHKAQEWIRDQQTKKPMAHQWVFAGSRFMKNPDRPMDPDYYGANSGEVISISNFVDSMLEVPVSVSRENASLNFQAETSKIPPQLSKVWVILEPVSEKK